MRIGKRLSGYEAMEVYWPIRKWSARRAKNGSRNRNGRVAILKLTVLSPATRILKQAVAPAWCARSVPKLGEHRAP